MVALNVLKDVEWSESKQSWPGSVWSECSHWSVVERSWTRGETATQPWLHIRQGQCLDSTSQLSTNRLYVLFMFASCHHHAKYRQNSALQQTAL